jgi:uncharacterized lipoprotein YddW (UPF0748 family)
MLLYRDCSVDQMLWGDRIMRQMHQFILTSLSLLTLFVLFSDCVDAADGPQPLRASYFHPNRVIPPKGTPEEQTTAIRSALDRFESSGFNAIFPYFTGSSGDAYYSSTIHATRVYGERDPLAELIREAQSRKIQVYPVLCVTVCGNDAPTGILNQHPEWALRHPDGSLLGYISPAHPDARKWLASVANEIVRKYQPDGIILDYIRYHNRPLLLDPAAAERFRASLPAGATPEQEKQLMQQFKEDELTELVRLYSETVRNARSGTLLGIYSWGPHVAANHQIAQCWPRWVKDGYLDLVNVSGYYHHDKYGEKYLAMFEEKMRSAVELNRGTGRPVPLSFALGVETSHGKVHSAEDIRIYLTKAAETQLDGFVVFTWNTLLPYLDELDQTRDIRNFPDR